MELNSVLKHEGRIMRSPFVVSLMRENERLRAALRSETDEHNKAKARVQYLALHDPVTDIPNRAYFQEMLAGLVQQAGQRIGVFMIDLDRFSFLNDAAGYRVGDAVLKEIAQRLRIVAPPGSVIANMWGDRFWLAVPGVKEFHNIDQLAEKVLETCRQPLLVGSRKFHVTASIGICVFPDD